MKRCGKEDHGALKTSTCRACLSVVAGEICFSMLRYTIPVLSAERASYECIKKKKYARATGQ